MSDPVQTTAPSVERARALIESRLGELDAERDRLREALAHLTPSTPRTSPTRARRRRSRRARRGQRQAEFLELLRASPGASMADLARQMGVRPQQLYAVARRLTESGAVAKRDGGYVALDGTAPGGTPERAAAPQAAS
jgi:hypothetical protein